MEELISDDWVIGLHDIATAPDESDVEWGIDRALGDRGLLDSGWSQALTNRR